MEASPAQELLLSSENGDNSRKRAGGSDEDELGEVAKLTATVGEPTVSTV
jgi:hypothetical protein